MFKRLNLILGYIWLNNREKSLNTKAAKVTKADFHHKGQLRMQYLHCYAKGVQVQEACSMLIQRRLSMSRIYRILNW